MKRGLFTVLIFVLLLSSVSAQYVTPLDCDKLFNESAFESRTEYEELATVCFYGSGFSDDTVTVKLEGDTDYQLNAPVSNGVISSIVNNVKNFFDGVVSGVYRLVVTENNENYEYPDNITVTGETEKPNEPEDPPEEEPEEIPEFSTIAAAAALAGAAFYINKRRK